MALENTNTQNKEEELLTQDIVSKLKFISKIQPHQLIDLKSFSIMEQSISTSLYRTCIRMGTENRENVLLFFINTVNSSLELIYKLFSYNQEYHTNIALMIFSSLDKARNGIINFKKTYIEDIMFCAKIETLLETLDIKYNNLKNMLMQLKN